MKRSSEHTNLSNAFTVKYAENRSIERKEDYYYIVSNPAYKDFTPRTIKGVKKETIQDALNELADKIYEYFHNDNINKSFDEWHKYTSNSFIERFKELSGITIKHGKAQKIINMTFKYLFCFNDSQKYKHKFEFCHMPLDTYTIEWFCNEVLSSNNNDTNKEDSISTTAIKDNSWSKLDYGDKEKIYSYMWIQEKIKNYLSKGSHKYIDEKGKPLSPFTAEFYIWPEQNFIKAYKEFIKQTVLMDSYPKYSDEELSKICNNIQQNLSKAIEKFKN